MNGESSRDGHHRLLGLATLLGAVVLLVAMVFGLTAGVGTIWSAVTSLPPPPTMAAPTTVPTSTPTTTSTVPTTTIPKSTSTAVTAGSATVHLTVNINTVSTAGGPQPAFVGPNGAGASSLLTAHVGQQVVLTIVNHTNMPHTFTAAAFGVNETIMGGARASFSFTPKQAGQVSWLCVVPCGTWVMSHNGYMMGFVTVVAS